GEGGDRLVRQLRPGLGHIEPAVPGKARQKRFVEGNRGRLPAGRDVQHRTYLLMGRRTVSPEGWRDKDDALRPRRTAAALRRPRRRREARWRDRAMSAHIRGGCWESSRASARHAAGRPDWTPRPPRR